MAPSMQKITLFKEACLSACLPVVQSFYANGPDREKLSIYAHAASPWHGQPSQYRA